MSYKKEEKRTARKFQREETSILGLTLIQAALVILSAVAVHYGQPLLSAALFFPALLGFCGRLWAKAAVKNVSIRVKAKKSRMFPGDETVLNYQIKNNKLLPLLWADILQPLKKPVCMRPVGKDGENLADRMDGSEKVMFGILPEETEEIFRQRCSMIGGWKTVRFATKWKAERRGIYILDQTRIYVGDGFHIARYRMRPAAGSQKNFVIYPQIIPVDTEAFLKNMWEGDTGSKGVLEDVSVIRLTRPYASTDSLKRMNWRLVARGQGMSVNQYEVISPQEIHIIFDGESFNGTVFREKELELTLSILASLLLRLQERSMECGFSFPATERLDGANIFAGEGNTGEILYRMAEYQPCRPVTRKNEQTWKEETVYQPSRFQEESLLEGSQPIGKYYFITFDRKSAADSALLKKMKNRPVEVMTFQSLCKLRRGGAIKNESV